VKFYTPFNENILNKNIVLRQSKLNSCVRKTINYTVHLPYHTVHTVHTAIMAGYPYFDPNLTEI